MMRLSAVSDQLSGQTAAVMINWAWISHDELKAEG